MRLLLLLFATVSVGACRAGDAVHSHSGCTDCRFVLEPVVTLGRGDGPSLMRMSTAAVDSRGNYYVAPTYNTGEIARYDRRGRFVGKFGREGRGPGEFGNFIHRMVVGPGDSLHVLELNRHTVLAPGLSAVASVRMLPVLPHDLVFLSDGTLVIQHPIADAEGVGQPLHRVGPDGRIVRSFGGTLRLDPKKTYQGSRRLGAAPGNRFWAAHAGEYRIELWGPDGTRRRSLVRDTRWFRPWADRVDGSREAMRHPRIVDVAEDGAGRLWVNIAVPDPDRRPERSGGERPTEEVDPDEEADTILEVLDPLNGRVLARARFDRSLRSFIGDEPLVTSSREDADGNKLLDVWRVRLAGGDGGGER